MLTVEQIKQNDHISTLEIECDIEDTQREIDQFKKEVSALMGNPLANRAAIMMRESGIAKREEFISKLNQILQYRKNLKP